jgi:hypothetical protein
MMEKSSRAVLRSCGIAVALAVVQFAAIGLTTTAVRAEEHGGGGGNSPPPVDTTTNPEATSLNLRNPYAIHAGPGKPNVGSIYLPPTLSGKDKGKNKSGQTEQNVMGGAPEH